MRPRTPPFRFSFTALRAAIPATEPLVALAGFALPLNTLRPRARWLLGGIGLACALFAATSVAVRTVPWFGPLLADSLRWTVGKDAVARLEETVAHIDDSVLSVTSRGEARSLRDTTSSDLLGAVAPATTAPLELSTPEEARPMYSLTAAEGDGQWQRLTLRDGEDTAIHRTLLHPDPERTYSELFVFALPLSKLEVHAVAGSVEPARERDKRAIARPGLIPEADRGRLVAAFNGGFKAEHGQFGMMVGGQELLPPKSASCTFAATKDGGLTIATWKTLASGAPALDWWRQTPGCMLEGGVLHPGLRSQDSRNWGATIDGKTVIRRSAVGLSRDAKTLFVGISNYTTARALALGMQNAGAEHVAQLDVNHSYPRFLLYRDDEASGTLTALSPVKGFLHEKDEYLRRPSSRDFFYVTTR